MGGASLPLLDEAGKNGGGAARPPGHRAKRWAGVAGVACLAVGCIVVTAFSGQDVGARAGGSARGQELLQQDLILFKMEPPPEPWDPPSNLYMWVFIAPSSSLHHPCSDPHSHLHTADCTRVAFYVYRQNECEDHAVEQLPWTICCLHTRPAFPAFSPKKHPRQCSPSTLELLLISLLPADRAPPRECPHDSKIRM
jgi:hypothetical protein